MFIPLEPDEPPRETGEVADVRADVEHRQPRPELVADDGGLARLPHALVLERGQDEPVLGRKVENAEVELDSNGAAEVGHGRSLLLRRERQEAQAQRTSRDSCAHMAEHS